MDVGIILQVTMLPLIDMHMNPEARKDFATTLPEAQHIY